MDYWSSAANHSLHKFHCHCAMLLAKLDIVYGYPPSIVFSTALVMARMYLPYLI